MHNLGSLSFLRAAGVQLAVLLALPAAVIAAQTPAGTQSTANSPAASPCSVLPSGGIPVSETLRGKVVGFLDSGHLKPGKEIWFEAATGEAFPGCTVDQGSPIYARVIAQTSTKKPDSSELTLSFDRADCEGHSKAPVKMILLGVWTPEANAGSIHDSVPTEVAGGSRQISDAAAETNGWDQRLNPGGQQGTIKPGVIIGMPALTLDPQGGPSCSARLTSTKRKIEFGPSTVLFLALVKTEQK